MKTVIMYNISEEIRIFSNKTKAFNFAQSYGYDRSYYHFCRMLKSGKGEFFRSSSGIKGSLQHTINQKPVE